MRRKARQEAKALWERRQNEELLYIGSQFSYIFSEKYLIVPLNEQVSGITL